MSSFDAITAARVKLDLEYIDGLCLDFKVLLRPLPAALFGLGAR